MIKNRRKPTLHLASILVLIALITYLQPLLQITKSNYPLHPPIAPKSKSYYTVGSTTFEDDYLYLRNLNNSDVRRLIKEEGAYADQYFARDETLKRIIIDKLTEDSKLEMDHNCFNVSGDIINIWQDGDYTYWISNYGSRDVYNRRRDVNDECACLNSTEDIEVVLDLNIVIQSASVNVKVGIFEVSFDGTLLSYSIDTIGNERYDLFVIHLKSKKVLAGPISDTYYSASWSLDNYLYYNVVSLKWGIPLSIDKIGPFNVPSYHLIHVYSEIDPTFTAEVVQTSDRKHLFVKIAGLVTSEWKEITDNGLKDTLGRTQGVIYEIEHNGGQFYVRKNSVAAPEYEIVRLSLTYKLIDVVLAHSNGSHIEKFEMLDRFMAVWHLVGGLRQLQFIDLGSNSSFNLPIETSVYSITQDLTQDFDTRAKRRFNSSCFMFSNSSFLQPPNLFSINLLDQKVSLILASTSAKSRSTEYTSKVLYASTFDTNENIAITYVIKKSHSNVRRPLLLTAYGAYGSLTESSYDSSIFTFLDRGFIYAICHPRGDGDNGSSWYEKGKKQYKSNTFRDTQSCLDELVRAGLVDKNKIALKGRSAGGLIAGHAIVTKSEIQPVVVIGNVPFVDPIYDLMDTSIPWTIYELEEYGNPLDGEILRAMVDYSPYHLIDNLNFTPPAVYFSSGINDPRVPFYEPLKFCAKLRNKILVEGILGSNVIVRVDEGGHFSAHGVEAMAEWILFVLMTIET